MLRSLSLIGIALIIALVGSIFSVDRVTSSFEGLRSIEFGAWKAWPEAGSPTADPYAKARAARAGRIPLGGAEGLAFIAVTDDSGEELNAACNYVISGNTPNARLWTLRVTDEELFPLGSRNVGVYALHSLDILRKQDGTFEISLARDIKPYNWLQLSGVGIRKLVLTLYDTSVATTIGVAEIKMPKIEKVGCSDA